MWCLRFVVLFLLAVLGACAHIDPVDMRMGEAWMAPGVPPPHQDRPGTPNVALMETSALWARVEAADPVERRVLVALKAPGSSRGHFRGVPLVDAPARDAAITALRQFGTIRDMPSPPLEIGIPLGRKFLFWQRELPLVSMRLRSINDLSALRSLPFVDYVEPQVVLMDSLACGFDPYTPGTEPRAQDETFGRDIVPYPYRHHGVQDAWRRWENIVALSHTWGWPHAFGPGGSEVAAILDSGVSSKQIDTAATRMFNETTESAEDLCMHGTKVASVAVGGINNVGVAGVAYDATLVPIKIVHNPLASKSDVGAICRGLADAASLKPSVVGMAFGLTYYSPTIASCLEAAFNDSPRTIFIGAAGSTVPDVVFPANHKPFVTAVSMVQIVPDVPGYRLFARPLTVAYGKDVDFVSVMTSDGLPAAGPVGGVGGMGGNDINRFKWSSAATGLYTGMATFVQQHASDEGWTRAQAISAMRMSASRANIADVHGEPLPDIVGQGILDVYRATGGVRHVEIHSPSVVAAGATINFQATDDAAHPPGAGPDHWTTYDWSIDGKRVEDLPGFWGKSTLRWTAPAEERDVTIRVVVKDHRDGPQPEATRTVHVVANAPPPVKERFLYWRSYVEDHASFFDGGRHDRFVNVGRRLPTDCGVQAVRAVLVCGSNGDYCQSEAPYNGEVNRDAGNVGFSIIRPGGLPAESLEVLVHQWHDGLSAVRTKVIYEVLQPAGVDCLSGVEDLLYDGP